MAITGSLNFLSASLTGSVNINIDFGLCFEPDRHESVKIDINQFESQLKQ